jgi:hypothetical protein
MTSHGPASPASPASSSRAAISIAALAVVLLGVLAFVLAFARAGGRTVSGTGSVPTGPPSTAATVTTGAGDLAVLDVRLTDRFPADCVTGQSGCLVSAGDRIVVVTLSSAPGRSADQTAAALGTGAFDSYLDAASGERVDLNQIFYVNGSHRIELAYAYLPSAQPLAALTLHYPGNPPIALGPVSTGVESG